MSEPTSAEDNAAGASEWGTEDGMVEEDSNGTLEGGTEDETLMGFTAVSANDNDKGQHISGLTAIELWEGATLTEEDALLVTWKKEISHRQKRHKNAHQIVRWPNHTPE